MYHTTFRVVDYSIYIYIYATTQHVCLRDTIDVSAEINVKDLEGHMWLCDVAFVLESKISPRFHVVQNSDDRQKQIVGVAPSPDQMQPDLIRFLVEYGSVPICCGLPVSKL